MPVDDEERELRAEDLKERIYITFASLAVVITLAGHGEVDAGGAALTLGVTVLGTLLAVFTADVISHTVVHERWMTATEFRRSAYTSFGALAVVILPFVFLGLAALQVWATHTALVVSAFALLASLVLVGYLAVRRIPLSWWQRLIALGAEAVLGLAVVGLQLLAHH